MDAVERPPGDVLRGQENNSRPEGSPLGSPLRERRDERRYGEESEQRSTSVVEVVGVATLNFRFVVGLEGCADVGGGNWEHAQLAARVCAVR